MREAATYSLPPFSNEKAKTLQAFIKYSCFSSTDKLLLSINFIVFMYNLFNSMFCRCFGAIWITPLPFRRKWIWISIYCYMIRMNCKKTQYIDFFLMVWYNVTIIIWKRGDIMPKRNIKQTSHRVASIASKVLRDGRTSKASKTTAGSALSQAKPKK